MADSLEISALPVAGVYRLLLPESVANLLKLTEPAGKALFITHQNKMQLEWLRQSIWEQYHTASEAFTAGKARLKRRKQWATATLLLAAVVALFNVRLSQLAHIDVLYIKVLSFTIGVICCLQLLKYFAMGMTLAGRDSGAEQRVLELKELILKDFSMEE
jgi:hypothetical protein